MWVLIALAIGASGLFNLTGIDRPAIAADATNPVEAKEVKGANEAKKTKTAENPLPLHEKIDAALDATHRDAHLPPVGIVDDTTFLRRVWLDLAGSAPTAEHVRVFLADDRRNKRAAVIDQLLDSERFPQHMATVFDVMFMERRADKYVKNAQWRAYLVDAFSQNKPYNVIVREMLAADGADPKTRARAAFVLNREAEANLLTRDISRIFLGRDLQCAQCHDHPDISDLRQSEYYNLFAFLQRTSLFTDKKKVAMLAEKAVGEANYESVFTKARYTVKPKVRGGNMVTDPDIESAKGYKVKPAKTVRAVPTYSRREQLAVELGKGESPAFRRNIVNRLWAHMMGRGLVHPVDMLHGGNPASHPELLDLLADEFAAIDFNVKAMLRELALSKAYQRPFELPERFPEKFKDDREPLKQQLASLKEQRSKLSDRVYDSFDQLDEVDAALIEAAKATEEHRNAVGAQRKTLAAAQKAAAPANAALAKTQQQLAAKEKLRAALQDAVEEAKDAVALADDPLVTKATSLLESRATQVASEMKSLEAARVKQAAAAEQVNAKVQAAQAKMNDAAAKFDAAQAALAEKRASIQSTLATHQAHTDALAMIEREIEQKSALLAMAEGRGESLDLAKRTAADALSGRGVLRPLKPLTPEQLAWSMMQATGVLEANRRAVGSDLKKKAATAAAKATAEARKNDKDAAAVQPKPVAPAQIEQALHDKLAGSVNAFIDLFAPGDGQPQDTFFATVDQALFLSNASTLKSWLAPSSSLLVGRLNQEKDAQALANELYLSVLSREPSADEVRDVAAYLEDREKDRVAALQEMAWALMTSVEFRFCR